MVVSPVHECLHHLQTLVGVGSTAERHRPQQGNRPFSLRRRHVSTSHQPRQMCEHVCNNVSLSECAQSACYYTLHATVKQRVEEREGKGRAVSVN